MGDNHLEMKQINLGQYDLPIMLGAVGHLGLRSHSTMEGMRHAVYDSLILSPKI